MKRFLAFFIMITIITACFAANAGVLVSEADSTEYVLVKNGTVPPNCTLDKTVTYDGEATGKWLTKGLGSQVVVPVTQDVSGYRFLKVQLYSPKATDDTIGLHLRDIKTYSTKTVKIDWTGWKTIEYDISAVSNVDKTALSSVDLWDHGWKYTYGDAIEGSDKNGSLNIGKIWFTNIKNEVGYESAVVDLDSQSVAYPLNSEYSKIATNTIEWTDQVKCTHLDFYNLGVTDFTSYSHLTFWMYSAKATNSELLIGLKSESGYYSYKIRIDFEGWKHLRLPVNKFTKNKDGDLSKVSMLWMYADGWGMTPDPETKIYIDSIFAENLPVINPFGIECSKYPLVDMSTLRGDYTVSSDIRKTSTQSIAWTDQTKPTHLDFNSPAITDWTGFTHLTVWVYSEKATGSKCLIGVVKEKDGQEDGYFTYGFDVDFTGWKQIIFPVDAYAKDGLKVKRVWMYAEGWGMKPNPETKIYIDTLYLENNISPSYTNASSVSYDSAEEISEIAKDIVFWHYGDSLIIKYASPVKMGAENDFVTDGKRVYMPKEYYEAAFGATVSGSTITLGGKSVEAEPLTHNGKDYYLLKTVAEGFGYEWYRDGGVVVVSPKGLETYLESPHKTTIEQLFSTRDPELIQVTPEDFEALIQSWQSYLTGNGYSDDTANLIRKASNSNTAMNLLSSKGTPDLNAGSSSDKYILGYWNKKITTTAEMKVQFNNLYQMARGYATEGTKAYKNEKLKTAIFEIMDWLYENIYGIDEMNNTGWRDNTLFNWHEWNIGVPTDLTQTLLLMRDEMTDDEIRKYLTVTDFFTQYESGSGTNLIHMLIPKFISCLLRYDSENFFEYKSFLEADMTYRTTSDGHGMYEDGSYKFHYYYAMNGTYGLSYLEAMAELLEILDNSPFELSGKNIDDFMEWIFKGYVPVLYDGRLMTMFRGRSPGGEVDCAKQTVNAMLSVVNHMTYEQKEKILPWLKYHLAASGADKNTMNFASVDKYNEIIENSDIEAYDTNGIFNSYYVTDKALWKTSKSAVAISMSSSRTSGWESINGANKTGWYQGDGVTYIYGSDTSNFSSQYFAYADPYMLPGTTVDSQKRIAETIKDSEVYQSSKNFVGSLSIDKKYGVAAMDLESYHSEGGTTVTDYGNSPPAHENDLVAKKAWFAFDDEVVCLGAGINSTMNSEVKTIVENRIDDSKTLALDSGKLTLGIKDDISDASFAHIEGVSGYVFEKGQSIMASTETNTRVFTKMWITHGENPENADYAYTLLPGATLEETKAYSQNKDTEILINTPEIQAVHDKSTGITSYVFRQAGSFDGLTTSEPMIVSKKYEGSKIVLSVCDPSQKLESASITLSDEYGDEKIDFSFPTPRGDTLELEIYPKAPIEAYVYDDETLKLKNNGSQKLSLYAVFASYDSNALNEVFAVKKEIEPGGNADIQFDGFAFEKIFIWYLPGLKPVYEPIVIR